MRVLPAVLLATVIATSLPAGCGDGADVSDFSVAVDGSAGVDLSVPCSHVTTWPPIGAAFFTPLGHGSKDVATVRSNLAVAGGDAGSHTDQLLIEVRTTPGANVQYPRSVTLDATTTYDTCDECITIGENLVDDTPTRRFLARSGTLFLSRVDQMKVGRIEVGAGSVHLVEWGANDAAVPGGGCYDIDSAMFGFDYTGGPITGQTDM